MNKLTICYIDPTAGPKEELKELSTGLDTASITFGMVVWKRARYRIYEKENTVDIRGERTVKVKMFMYL